MKPSKIKGLALI